jgi:hypothetical protein
MKKLGIIPLIPQNTPFAYVFANTALAGGVVGGYADSRIMIYNRCQIFRRDIIPANVAKYHLFIATLYFYRYD